MDERTERGEVVHLPHGTAVVVCERCPFREGPNEDAAVLVPLDERRSVLAVADGMGGQPGGDQASTLAMAALVESIGRVGPDATALRVAILNGFEAADEAIRDAGAGGGTTLAVVEIDGRSVRPYHVGDSVIMVVGQRGRVRFQSVAHSPVGYAVEAGLLDEGDAMHHQDRHLVSNFVGSAEMRIDVGPALTLQARDTVVLGSDGLFDNLHVEEVVERVRRGPLAAAAEDLARTGRHRMVEPCADHPSKADDLTFILYRPDPRAGNGASAGATRTD